MKLTKFFALGFAAIALMATSCSDDKDEPNPNPDPILSEGLPASVDGSTFTTNAQGQVTKVANDDVTINFEYGTFTRATEYNAKMTVSYKGEDSIDDYEMYLQLNAQGYISYALQVFADPEEEDATWKFEYNADGRMTRLQRSESGDDFHIAYSNGDITTVTQDDEDGDHTVYTFTYTNDTFKTPVVNKGNMMLFDDFFRIDMDEMGVAYFAGLLGRSTVNLPMGYTENWKDGETGHTREYKETYGWEFNSNQLPVKFWEESEPEYFLTFSWK